MIGLSTADWLCLALVPVLGQPAPGKPDEAAENEDDATISVDFPGGSIAEYVAALKSRDDGLNVIVDAQAGQVPLPPISLKAVTLGDALSLIQLASDPNANVQTLLKWLREGARHPRRASLHGRAAAVPGHGIVSVP